MQDAGRATILAQESRCVDANAEALASAYLNASTGNPSLALRLATADRVADLERLQAVSPSFKR